MLQKNSAIVQTKNFLFLVCDAGESSGKFRVLSTRVEPLTFWLIVQILYINPRTYTPIHTPQWYKGGEWTPSLEFLICCSISKRFYHQWKAFNLLYKMRYILGWWRCWGPVTSPTIVAILAAIFNFTKN